jgi:energy-coupling factor transporter ATP-binding protein EcfA2
MSALDSIIKWAEEDLLDWQSDAVRRLLIQEELSSEDKEEILRMIKESHDIKDPKHPAPKPQPLKKGDVSGAPQTTVKITLKALKDLKGVNAIPDGSGLSFAHRGLTVIYGENGSGKSGYARVLKKACNARDTKEKLLPNVYNKKSQRPSQAIIKYSIDDGADEEIKWKDGEKAETNMLSNICVFDSKCARVIVDENNEATYLPYGANVFEEMVSLYKELRQTLDAQKPKPEKLQYADIPDSTKAGKFISDLNHETRDEDIKEASKWADNDEKNLAKLKKQITKIEIDTPEKQAQRLRNLKSRIITISDAIQKINDAISEEKAQNIKQKITNLIAAERALAIASQKSLSGEPLPGAGEKAWQNLYNAAKEYSTHVAYPRKEFPVTEEGSLCVLCMQPLELDARTRMLRFKEFMEKATKKDVDAALTDLGDAVSGVESLQFPIPESYKDIADEFREKHQELISQTEEYFPAMEARAKEIIQAVNDKKEGAEFQSPRLSPDQGLKDLASQLEEEAKEIEKIAAEYEQKKDEKAELEARKLFSTRQEQVLDYVSQLRLAKKYESCISETEFIGITKKGKKIIIETLTPELIAGLEEELENFEAKHLRLTLRATGKEGETKHKLELEGIQIFPKTNLSDILSEGEHCVVAIAGFLAELKMANHECPIVFDDPVCSLDHNYRAKIAKRLVEEAKTRQVIVFTHDIAFLMELESKAAEIGAEVCFTPQTVCRLSDTVGRCLDGLPWHTMRVKDRLTYLRERLNTFKGLYGVNQPEYNREAAESYGLLRETWEAAVEEILLYDTIKRHGKEVQTQRLKCVKVETKDYTAIHLGMAKCSEWMRGHDKSKALSENRPLPDEVMEDIEKLRQFVNEINKRHNLLREEREKALEPIGALMG